MSISLKNVYRIEEEPNLYIKLQQKYLRVEEEIKKQIFWGDAEDFYIQRGAGLELIGKRKIDLDLRTYLPMDIRFKGTLKEYQGKSMGDIEALDWADGLVIMPTGSGKTVFFCALSGRIKQKTLIITHTETILNQTSKEVERFLGFKPSLISEGKVDISQPVTVGLIQTISRQIESLKDEFGLIITDECHHAKAKSWFDSISKFSAVSKFGVTAELRRKDKLEYLIESIIGPKLTECRAPALQEDGHLAVPTIIPLYTKFFLGAVDFCGSRCYKFKDCELKEPHKECNYYKNAFWNYMIKKMTENDERNKLIVDVIQDNVGDFNLILSDRTAHLDELMKRLMTEGKFQKEVYAYVVHGKVKKVLREKRVEEFKKTGGICLGTTAIFGEGFNLPAMDRLYLTCPAGAVQRVTQRVGRIMRVKEGKGNPIVFDFIDQAEPTKILWFARRQTYIKLGCESQSYQ